MRPTAILSLLMVLIAQSEQSVQRRRPWGRRSDECVNGKGHDYRGLVSTTTSGRVCANWNSVVDVYASRYYRKGLGRHNYCRNPDGRRAPWCWVRKGSQPVRQYCAIPQCHAPKPTPTTTTVTTTTTIPAIPVQRDTEFTCGERKEDGRHFKIVGGAYTSVSSHPWIASIFSRRTFLFGGSLIAPCWVLTAAHCFREITSEEKVARLRVFLGKSATNRSEPLQEQSFRVAQVILHEGYRETGRNFDNDIALLRIESNRGECAVRTETVRTVCLPPAYTMLPPGTFCTVAGYGRDHTVFYTKHLKEGQVRLREQDQCRREAPENSMTNNMLCAASPDWKTPPAPTGRPTPARVTLAGRWCVRSKVACSCLAWSASGSCVQRGASQASTRASPTTTGGSPNTQACPHTHWDPCTPPSRA
ncbi:hypothetical protein ACEWY4_020831 [Coilia grayii]|uniref:trypsin n=1 Tax=Coilia grayii TaxID=363190 RepID=A0ABD1JAM7_9TELE